VKNTNSAAESGAFVRKTRGYSVVQNEALFNDSLSMSAKGLYALIAARIDYTAVPLTKQWLMNHCTEGERAFNRAWDMLKNNGYLVAHVRPANRGRFCYEYELRDSNNGWNGVYSQHRKTLLLEITLYKLLSLLAGNHELWATIRATNGFLQQIIVASGFWLVIVLA